MYSCTMAVPDPGGGGGGGGAGVHVPSTPHEEDVSVLKNILFANYMYGNGLVEFGVVWGVLWCFNGPHDGYANRSNSQTSLPRVIGSPIDSQTVLPRAEG